MGLLYGFVFNKTYTWHVQTNILPQKILQRWHPVLLESWQRTKHVCGLAQDFVDYRQKYIQFNTQQNKHHSKCSVPNFSAKHSIYSLFISTASLLFCCSSFPIQSIHPATSSVALLLSAVCTASTHRFECPHVIWSCVRKKMYFGIQ